MSTRTKPEMRPEPVAGRGDGLESFGLIHVVACTGAGVALAFALAFVARLT
jgi:hypothetical protein